MWNSHTQILQSKLWVRFVKGMTRKAAACRYWLHEHHFTSGYIFRVKSGPRSELSGSKAHRFPIPLIGSIACRLYWPFTEPLTCKESRNQHNLPMRIECFVAHWNQCPRSFM